jgi:hypothetical protein
MTVLIKGVVYFIKSVKTTAWCPKKLPSDQYTGEFFQILSYSDSPARNTTRSRGCPVIAYTGE